MVSTSISLTEGMNWHTISGYLISHWQTILFYAVFSIAIPIFAALLTIRFGPNRKEVSHLREAIDKMAADQEKQRRAAQFRCDVAFSGYDNGRVETEIQFCQPVSSSARGDGEW
jgi:hypothetical protein